MRYKTATAFRTALDQRLRDHAQETGLAVMRLRKRVAFELFLRRLVVVAPKRWVLKGALALEFRLPTTRSTKDIDLGRDDNEEAAIEDLSAAQQLTLDDFFAFSATKSSAFDDANEINAVRFHVRAELAERIFERFTLDIGFSNSFGWQPDTIQTSNFLSFADIAPIDLPAIPLSQHVAEKVHAYTRVYGKAGHPSMRPKDLVDILLIASTQALEADALRQALVTTFETRARQSLPRELPPPPPAWKEPYRQLAEEVAIEPELDAAFQRAAQFLDPVLAGEAVGTWDARAASWQRIDNTNGSVTPGLSHGVDR